MERDRKEEIVKYMAIGLEHYQLGFGHFLGYSIRGDSRFVNSVCPLGAACLGKGIDPHLLEDMTIDDMAFEQVANYLGITTRDTHKIAGSWDELECSNLLDNPELLPELAKKIIREA
jgi:hypothetical protein